MTMLRVRVEVADVPGALAALTAALAALEVDVSAIDVLEVDGRSVVDELRLRLPSGVRVQEVRDVLRMAGADVLSSAVDTARSDPVVSAFELMRSVLDVVGRRLNVRFSATEAARLRAFTTVLASLDTAGVTATLL